MKRDPPLPGPSDRLGPDAELRRRALTRVCQGTLVVLAALVYVGLALPGSGVRGRPQVAVLSVFAVAETALWAWRLLERGRVQAAARVWCTGVLAVITFDMCTLGANHPLRLWIAGCVFAGVIAGGRAVVGFLTIAGLAGAAIAWAVTAIEGHGQPLPADAWRVLSLVHLGLMVGLVGWSGRVLDRLTREAADARARVKRRLELLQDAAVQRRTAGDFAHNIGSLLNAATVAVQDALGAVSGPMTPRWRRFAALLGQGMSTKQRATAVELLRARAVPLDDALQRLQGSLDRIGTYVATRAALAEDLGASPADRSETDARAGGVAWIRRLDRWIPAECLREASTAVRVRVFMLMMTVTAVVIPLRLLAPYVLPRPGLTHFDRSTLPAVTLLIIGQVVALAVLRLRKRPEPAAGALMVFVCAALGLIAADLGVYAPALAWIAVTPTAFGLMGGRALGRATFVVCVAIAAVAFVSPASTWVPDDFAALAVAGMLHVAGIVMTVASVAWLHDALRAQHQAEAERIELDARLVHHQGEVARIVIDFARELDDHLANSYEIVDWLDSDRGLRSWAARIERQDEEATDAGFRRDVTGFTYELEQLSNRLTELGARLGSRAREHDVPVVVDQIRVEALLREGGGTWWAVGDLGVWVEVDRLTSAALAGAVRSYTSVHGTRANHVFVEQDGERVVLTFPCRPQSQSPCLPGGVLHDASNWAAAMGGSLRVRADERALVWSLRFAGRERAAA